MNKKETSVYISKHSQTLILYGISERLRQAEGNLQRAVQAEGVRGIFNDTSKVLRK